jgi:hypothetical protein
LSSEQLHGTGPQRCAIGIGPGRATEADRLLATAALPADR